MTDEELRKLQALGRWSLDNEVRTTVQPCEACGGNRLHEDGKCAYCAQERGKGPHKATYTVCQAAYLWCPGCSEHRLAHIRTASLAVCGTCCLPICLDPPI